MKKIRVAIDGPASSGKSTVAKMLAKDLGYTYLDTGAMYRCITYLTLEHCLTADDAKQMIDLLDSYPIRFEPVTNGQRVFIGDRDVTLAIRQNDVTSNVSWVAALPEIREKLVSIQREIAKEGGIIMDGRDIGTVVLPEAELKIFLVASVEERAQRRLAENQEKGIPSDFERLKKEIEERDYKDSHREVSPLKPSEDAIIFDTTGIAIQDVKTFILEKVEKLVDKASVS